jgi:hypothetical protein
MSLNPIGEITREWAERNLKGPVRMYDFGDGSTVMPLYDLGSASYLTASICYLYLEGKGPLKQGQRLPRCEEDKVMDFGNGWKFLPLEFGYQTKPEQLHEALEKAKARLLQEIA